MSDELRAKIPEYTANAIDIWVTEGALPGDFLYNVLTNNLFSAVGHADQRNLQALPEIVQYIYNYTPSACWGSKEKVNKWAEDMEVYKTN